MLIQRVVITPIQILYDEGLFDAYPNADEVLKDFSFTASRSIDLTEQVNDIVQKFLFINTI